MVDQAVGEFQMLVDMAVRELKRSLSRASSRGVSFLKERAADGPLAVDVRLLPPAGPFPTVAGVVASKVRVSPHTPALLWTRIRIMHAQPATKTYLNNARCCFRRPVWAIAPRPRLTWGLAPAAFKVSMACRRLRKSVGRNCVLPIGHAWNVVGISRRFARATGCRTVGPNASRLRHTLGRALRQ